MVRTKEQIMSQQKDQNKAGWGLEPFNNLALEVLIDIRDQLKKIADCEYNGQFLVGKPDGS